MRTSGPEPLNQAEALSRLVATLGALIRDQVDVTRRYVDPDRAASESTGLAAVVELAVGLVERSAEWLELGELAQITRDLREALSQLDQLRPAQRVEMVAHCKVALEAEERLAEALHAGGLEALVERAALVSSTAQRVRGDHVQADRLRATVDTLATPRGVIDDTAPDVGPQDDLLGLTFEIKSALAQQNERIGGMTSLIDGTLRALQAGMSDWERALRGSARGKRKESAAEVEFPDGPALAFQHRIEDVSAGLRALEQELHQLLGIQYSLERRARDLDEHLLWEFLDPLDRFIDDMVAAVSKHPERGVPILTVQTGGVGFEPDIGATLVPLLLHVLETGEPAEREGTTSEIRVLASREGLEARLSIEGFRTLDPGPVERLERALEDLSGFVRREGGGMVPLALRLQFPMARSLRNFLVVEAAAHRVALPWSAIERVYASEDEGGGGAREAIPRFPLERIFGDLDEAPAVVPRASRAGSDQRAESRLRPFALVRCGGRSGVVEFDRIVWRESARLTALPPRLYPTDEVLGGIVGPDSSVTLVLNPRAITMPEHDSEPGDEGARA